MLFTITTTWFTAFVFGNRWALLGLGISGLELWRLRREAARRET